MSPFHRFYSRAQQSTTYIASGAALIAAAHLSDLMFQSFDSHVSNRCNVATIDVSNDSETCLTQCPVSATCENIGNSANNTNLTQSAMLASSPINDSSSTWRKNHSTDTQNNTIDCDYIIIGHGRAGQSAVRTLKALDPTADIVILDPNNNSMYQSNNTEQTKRRRKGGTIRHIPTRATCIDHASKLVNISSIQPHTVEQSEVQKIHYRKSILLSTGSRGAPPPEECIGPNAKSRLLELRSTSIPSMKISTTTPSVHKDQLPILDPVTVRSLSLMAASQGATVAVMGSGFEALELAASLAGASPKLSEDDTIKTQLLFGTSGPLSGRLPRYLSAAISKRLRQCGIDVEERSMTRYLSMENSTEIPRLEIYTVKSYDRLDSRRLVTDLVVLAPSVCGMNGTAVLPTENDSDEKTRGNDYKPWSSLIDPSLLTCYLEDGRVATNSELLAASSIYAAGSVAKYPNGRTGQADMAGGDHMSAEVSGDIAARNMVKESFTGKNKKQEMEIAPCHVQESIPVWRSDQVPYLNKNDGQQASTDALYSMGIHSLCVGKCDSTSMATHGFWWTNTNNNNNSNDGKNSKDVDNATSEYKVRPNTIMRRMTRRATNSTSNGSFRRGGSLPVYGSGVVYYLDQCGSIQGVMLWGLPFSDDPSNIHSGINDGLLQRMKNIIRSNGGVVIRDHSDNIMKDSYGVTMDVSLLSYLHLSEESKHLAALALTGRIEKVSKIVLSRPLHRYTPWKSSEMNNLGKVRRKDDMGQTAGADDLFYTNSDTTSMAPSNANQWIDEPIRPPSLKRIYTMQGEATWLANAEAWYIQQERSRPPKEDPLWLRQTEEYRFVNKKDVMANDFISNMISGQFSDGSDAVKQAPVPKMYLDAKEKLSSWAADDAEEEDDGDEVD